MNISFSKGNNSYSMLLWEPLHGIEYCQCRRRHLDLIHFLENPGLDTQLDLLPSLEQVIVLNKCKHTCSQNSQENIMLIQKEVFQAILSLEIMTLLANSDFSREIELMLIQREKFKTILISTQVVLLPRLLFLIELQRVKTLIQILPKNSKSKEEVRIKMINSGVWVKSMVLKTLLSALKKSLKIARVTQSNFKSSSTRKMMNFCLYQLDHSMSSLPRKNKIWRITKGLYIIGMEVKNTTHLT